MDTENERRRAAAAMTDAKAFLIRSLAFAVVVATVAGAAVLGWWMA